MTSTARQTLLLWPSEQSWSDRDEYGIDDIDEYFVELNDNERVIMIPYDDNDIMIMITRSMIMNG